MIVQTYISGANCIVYFNISFLALEVEPEKQETCVEENEIDRLREKLIYEELLNMRTALKARILQERHEIEKLTELLAEQMSLGKSKTPVTDRVHSPSEAEMTAMVQLNSENQLLEVTCKSSNLLSKYFS